jgi:hypothetical protein
MLKKSNIRLRHDDDEHIKQEGYLFIELFELPEPVIFFNFLHFSFFDLQAFSRGFITQEHSESSPKRPTFGSLRGALARLSSAFDRSKM